MEWLLYLVITNVNEVSIEVVDGFESKKECEAHATVFKRNKIFRTITADCLRRKNDV